MLKIKRLDVNTHGRDFVCGDIHGSYSCVERFYDAVNWVPRKPSEAVQTDLFDLFGI